MRKNSSCMPSILLVLLLLATSCSTTIDTDGEANGADTTSDPVKSEAPAETEAPSPAEIRDLDGYAFTFLNVTDGLWDSNSMILDYEELTGDTLNDAIYNRNRQAETDLHFTLEPAVRFDMFALTTEIRRSVLAAESLYDAAYVCTKDYANTIPYVCNLYDVDTIQITEDWWSPSFIESMTVGNSYLYGSVDYINNWTQLYMFFNTNMILDNGLHELGQPA